MHTMFDINDQHFNIEGNVDCNYYLPDEFHLHLPESNSDISHLSLLHVNSRSLQKNHDNLTHLLSTVQFDFSVIGVTETWLSEKSPDLVDIDGFQLIRADRKTGRGGGVGFYINHTLVPKIRNDLTFTLSNAEILSIEFDVAHHNSVIVCVIYRPPNSNMELFFEDLEILLEKINVSKKACCLMGDFNIDLVQENDSSSTFRNILLSNSFYNTIDKPTRITSQTASLIDNIFINIHRDTLRSGIFYADVSDHLPIFLIVSDLFPNKHHVPTKITKRKITSQSLNEFKIDLTSEDWTDVLSCHDTDNAYELFWKKFSFYFDKNCPIIEIDAKKQRKKHPWITNGILRSIKKRNKLYKAYLCNKSDAECFEKYKRYRNNLTTIIRESRKLHFHHQFEKAKNNCNSTWKVIKEILNKRNTCKINKFNFKDVSYETPKEIAEKFNEYFAGVGPNQAKKINRRGTDFTKFINNLFHKTIFLHSVDNNEILKITKSLKNSYATGHDEISTNLLKKIIKPILTPLCHIFNLSLVNGVFPNSFKIAKVVPIYKKGDPMDITNYRPISILPCFSKLLEKIVHSRVDSFFSRNNLFNPDQYGFRKSHSTDAAILKLYDRVSGALADHEHVIGVFMDLSKAFDTLDHKILLSKLQHYGVRGIALDWFSSYLSSRYQYTVHESCISQMLPLTCGVPQGSILGPLLFLIYINDLVNVSDSLQYILFADDTNIFCSHADYDTLIEKLNAELPKLSLWFRSNMLCLNVSKTNFIHFMSCKRVNNEEENKILFIDDIAIEQKTCTKFLGVVINENFNWQDHVKHISTPIARNIGIIRKLRHFVPKKSLFLLYNSLVLPYISYCNIVWANSPGSTNSILLLQKKAIRLCAGSSYRAHTDPIFYEHKILKISDLHFLQTAIFMFRHNLNRLPSYFMTMFHLNRQIHSYNTRYASNIHLNNPRTLLAQKSIRHSGPDVWNSLSLDIRSSSTVESFKTSVKNMLITRYK